MALELAFQVDLRLRPALGQLWPETEHLQNPNCRCRFLYLRNTQLVLARLDMVGRLMTVFSNVLADYYYLRLVVLHALHAPLTMLFALGVTAVTNRPDRYLATLRS